MEGEVVSGATKAELLPRGQRGCRKGLNNAGKKWCRRIGQMFTNEDFVSAPYSFDSAYDLRSLIPRCFSADCI